MRDLRQEAPAARGTRGKRHLLQNTTHARIKQNSPMQSTVECSAKSFLRAREKSGCGSEMKVRMDCFDRFPASTNLVAMRNRRITPLSCRRRCITSCMNYCFRHAESFRQINTSWFEGKIKYEFNETAKRNDAFIKGEVRAGETRVSISIGQFPRCFYCFLRDFQLRAMEVQEANTELKKRRHERLRQLYHAEAKMSGRRNLSCAQTFSFCANVLF